MSITYEINTIQEVTIPAPDLVELFWEGCLGNPLPKELIMFDYVYHVRTKETSINPATVRGIKTCRTRIEAIKIRMVDAE